MFRYNINRKRWQGEWEMAAIWSARCLANALHPWLFPLSGAQTFARQSSLQAPRRLFGSGFLRFVLSIVLLIAPGYALWCAGADLSGLAALSAGGSRANAQVIGREI